MARWEVRGQRQVVVVEAPNWMMALGAAMGSLGGPSLELSCLICDVKAGGTVSVFDTRQEISILLRELPPPTIQVVPVSPIGPAPDGLSTDQEQYPANTYSDDLSDESEAAEETYEFEAAAALPGFDMPLGQSLLVAPTEEEITERLFEESSAILEAETIEAAGEAALQILLRHVPSESSCVLRYSRRDRSLRFLVATGPTAASLRDLVLSADKGIAGFSTSTGASLIVHEALLDPRHNVDVDLHSGYDTRSVLAVALLDDNGRSQGCIELLNPPTAFTPAHLDLARAVASSLAEALRRLGV